jgi:hypothetical protein
MVAASTGRESFGVGDLPFFSDSFTGNPMSVKRKSKVLLVDDHLVVRKGLSLVIADDPSLVQEIVDCIGRSLVMHYEILGNLKNSFEN